MDGIMINRVFARRIGEFVRPCWHAPTLCFQQHSRIVRSFFEQAPNSPPFSGGVRGWAGGAYVPTLVVGMYAPLQHQKGADMPKNATSAPPLQCAPLSRITRDTSLGSRPRALPARSGPPYPPLPLFNRGGELDQSLDILPHTERPSPGRCGPLSSLYCWAQSVKRLGGKGSIQHGKSELKRPNSAGWT